MRSRTFSWRSLLAAFVAAAFAIAVVPGSMAMPAPQTMQADCQHHHTMPAGHIKQPRSHDTPCKGMAMCLGMFSCFGLSAVADHPAVVTKVQQYRPVAGADEASPGMSYPPDNPPPIA
jgi:hypothetical protein